MRHRYALALICLALGPLTMNGQALAHGTEHHRKMTPEDAARMAKLHAMMPVFSAAAAGLEAALEKGDTPAAEEEAGKILAAIPDLKQAKPHRNVTQRKKFQALAARLEETVASAAGLARKGDFPGARSAFAKVEQACAACHAKFR